MLHVCGVGVCECYVCVVLEYVSVTYVWCESMWVLRVCGVGVCECYVCVVWKCYMCAVWEYVSVMCVWCRSMCVQVLFVFDARKGIWTNVVFCCYILFFNFTSMNFIMKLATEWMERGRESVGKSWLDVERKFVLQ